MSEASVGAEVDTSCAGQVGVQVFDSAERTSWIMRSRRVAYQISKIVPKVGCGDLEAIGVEILVKARAESAAALRAQGGIAWTARIGTEGLKGSRFFNALAVKDSRTRVSPKPFGITQNKNGASARHDASAEAGICFGACAGHKR